MKHLKFTYVDALTGISIATAPAMNGTKFPEVPGLEFVWARESAYPTPTPEFFGTCPDESATQVDGVLGVFVESDWEQMRLDEVRARSPVPKSVSPSQIRRALTRSGLRTAVEAAVTVGDQDLKDWWEFATTIERNHQLVIGMALTLGVTESQLDDLFILATTL